MSVRIVARAHREEVGLMDGWVRPPRIARCSWRIGSMVPVHLDPERGAHFSGTERCASIWACPVCAAVIRSERAREIQAGVQRHLDLGGGAIFVTGTLRHRLDDPLKVGLNAVITGWQRLIRGSPWKRWSERLGLVGVVRSIEVTWGRHNGWHPHVHALVLSERPLTDDERGALEAWLSARWAGIVSRLGARTPDGVHGLVVKPVDGHGVVLAQYLAKVQETRIGAELARGDLKSGHGGSLMPFELLDVDTDQARALWLEYVDATHGRRCITWSRGLRERLALDEERTDDEVIEDTDAAPIVGVLDGPVYDWLRRTGRDWALLDQVEIGGCEAEEEPLLHLLLHREGWSRDDS